MAPVFALLAIGVPLFIVVALAFVGRTSASDNGLGMLVAVLIGAVWALSSFFMFGALAVIVSSPRGSGLRMARRVGLSLFGMVCTTYGSNAIRIVVEEPSVIVFFAIGVLLLPVGIGSFLVLWYDLRGHAADPESDQP